MNRGQVARVSNWGSISFVILFVFMEKSRVSVDWFGSERLREAGFGGSGSTGVSSCGERMVFGGILGLLLGSFVHGFVHEVEVCDDIVSSILTELEELVKEVLRRLGVSEHVIHFHGLVVAALKRLAEAIREGFFMLSSGYAELTEAIILTVGSKPFLSRS